MYGLGKYFLGLFRNSFFLGRFQGVERAVIGAVEGDVVALEKGEVGVDLLHGDEGSGGGFFVEEVGIAGDLVANLLREAGGFEAPGAELLPARGGEFFYEDHFVFGLGIEFVDEGFDLFVEAVGGFTFDYDGFAEEAVTDCVAGGGSFALLSDRTMRFSAIGAGGFDLSFGSHCDLSME